MKTNVFLNEKAKEKGLTAKEFAVRINVSEIYAKKLLTPGSKKLPSEDVVKRIVVALSLSGEEESELRKLIEEDRKELAGGPAPEPESESESESESEQVPEPPDEGQDISELKREIGKLAEELDESEEWIHGIEEMVRKYREESRVWGEKIEERIGRVEGALEDLRKSQEISFKKMRMWVIVLGILGGVVVAVSALGILFAVTGMFN